MQFRNLETTDTHRRDLETPVLIVDLNIMERNIEEYVAWADEADVALRPHIKTHKNGEIATYQSEVAGDTGVCCQTLSESEVMAEYVDSIYLSYNVVGESKLWRLVDLAARLDEFATTVDNPVHVDSLNTIAEEVDEVIDVIVEVDVGLHRTGVPPGEPTVELVKHIENKDNINFTGLLAYEAHVKSEARSREQYERLCREAMDVAADTVTEIESTGVTVDEVKVGGTATAQFSGEHPIVTEVNPGMFPFNDVGELRTRPFAVEKEDCAATIITTVISVPGDGRVVVDGGSKTFSLDKPDLPVPRHFDGVRYEQASEEHGWIDVSKVTESSIEIGDRIEFIVPHVCTTINLHDEFVGVRDGVVEKRFPVHARGNVK